MQGGGAFSEVGRDTEEKAEVGGLLAKRNNRAGPQRIASGVA